jgi:CspA family cold shock protein
MACLFRGQWRRAQDWRATELFCRAIEIPKHPAIVGGSTGDLGMAKGTVKWFNATKGYGFIQPQTGGKDVFVHISAVERAGLSNLNEGQIVEYEEVSNRGKTSAENLKVSK